jgi:hypothetical protein
MDIGHRQAPGRAAPSRRTTPFWLLAVALAGGLAAGSAAADEQTVYRSVETPYDPGAIFHTYSTAYFQFQTEASSTWGLVVAGNNFNGTPTGSFQHTAGITLPLGDGTVSATLTSSANMWARVQAGPDGLTFVDAPANTRYVHVAALGASVDVSLLEIEFSAPVQGFAFIGAGISDYGGSGFAGWPSQRIRLGGGPAIDVVGVNPNTIYAPLQLSFGVLSPTPFSQVSLVLPAGSANDNAGLASILVAYAAAPIPEPHALLLGVLGMPLLLWRRRHAQA